MKTGTSYFGNLFPTCQQVLGHACHIWYSLWLKSLTHNHSTPAGPSEDPLCHDGRVRQEVKGLRECPEALGIFQMKLKNIWKFWSLIKTHHLLVCNIINMMPYNGCSQMLHISLKTEKSFYRPPLTPVVRCWPWGVFSLWVASRDLRYSALQLLGESGACDPINNVTCC